MRNLTLLILTGPPASGKTLLLNALRTAGVRVLAVGESPRGREGVCACAANAEADVERMADDWRKYGATVHVADLRKVSDSLAWDWMGRQTRDRIK